MIQNGIIDRDSARLEIMHILATLGRSQGMYGRIFRNISRSPNKDEILDYIIDNYGAEPIGVISWAEGC